MRVHSFMEEESKPYCCKFNRSV